MQQPSVHNSGAVRWAGVAAIAAGGLLMGKRLWDFFGRGHVLAHTAYPEKDLLDHAFFLVPLLLSAAFIGLWRSAGGSSHVGRVNLGLALTGGTLQALGEFGETWFPSGFTWGLLAGLGFVLMSASLIWCGVVASRRSEVRARGLLALMLGLFVPLQLAAVMLPYHLWNDQALAAQAGLAAAVLFGLGWMLLGFVLWSGRDVRNGPGAAEHRL